MHKIICAHYFISQTNDFKGNVGENYKENNPPKKTKNLTKKTSNTPRTCGNLSSFLIRTRGRRYLNRIRNRCKKRVKNNSENDSKKLTHKEFFIRCIISDFLTQNKYSGIFSLYNFYEIFVIIF